MVYAFDADETGSQRLVSGADREKGARLSLGGRPANARFAALGAECTVLDYSEKQIESDLSVAGREEYQIDAIRADMAKPLPFDSDSFDLIFHPISNCYIEDVMHV